MMSSDFDFGFVLKTLGTAINKVVGLFGTEEKPEAGEQFESEHWSHFGFESRPHPKDDKGYCEVLFSRDQDVTICTKDRRYQINLKDGEVALFTGKDGSVKCRQVLKPDGTVLLQGKNLGIKVSAEAGDGGDAVISVEKNLTLTSTGKGTAAVITVKNDGGITAVAADGSNMLLDGKGKARLAVNGASVDLKLGQAVINAQNVNIIGTAGVGISPVKLPVATVGCMAGPFPIANGSTGLYAQYP